MDRDQQLPQEVPGFGFDALSQQLGIRIENIIVTVTGHVEWQSRKTRRSIT